MTTRRPLETAPRTPPEGHDNEAEPAVKGSWPLVKEEGGRLLWAVCGGGPVYEEAPELERIYRERTMQQNNLVLSLFPGIGLLDMAFEEAGFCIVRGPDVLWGGDVKRFHPPARVFGGIIGGPPCQLFSALRHLNPLAGAKHGNLIPEFERVVSEAQPQWFLMENVPDAPEPSVAGYVVRSIVLNNRQLGAAQERTRRFSFGTPDGLTIARQVAEQVLSRPINGEYSQAVTSSSRRVSVKIGGSGKVKRTYTEDGKRHGPAQGERTPIAEMCELQGLPPDFLSEAPFSETGKRKIIGNGVPLPMGRAIAQAVRAALDASDDRRTTRSGRGAQNGSCEVG